MYTSETWFVGLLRAMYYCSALVMEIATVDLCSYDGMATYLCLGIEICEFLYDVAVLRILLLVYLLLILILAVLLYAYVLVDLLVLAVW
jgi:hypothetical protein